MHKGAQGIGALLLNLFFGRYPHRNGSDGTHDEDVYHDDTYLGQGR